jgi:hypothetical protein
VNRNHLEICLSSFPKTNRNSLACVLPTLSVCPTSIFTHESSLGQISSWRAGIVSHRYEKLWSLRADARRSITLYYQTQVRLQGTGSEPHGLGPSSSVENRNSIACLPG